MNIIKLAFSRIGILAITVLVEVIFIVILLQYFLAQAAWIELVLRLLCVVLILYMIRFSRHLSSDMMWIVLMMVSPIAGGLLFIILGADMVLGKTFRSLIKETNNAKKYYHQNVEVIDELKEKYPEKSSQFQYLINEGYPVYHNRSFTYYELGETGFPTMLEELKKAKEYIFLEYFIIEEGKMWNSMLDIVKEKAAQGVKVRVMYDDMGSIGTLSYRYAKHLESYGIQAVSFNRVSPLVNIIMNHRDHRKIMVIDGKVAFSGGVNLADEYINAFPKYGKWKDNIIRVTGEAVDSYLTLFLTNWNAIRHDDEDYTIYYRNHEETQTDGYIVPYGETPLDEENTGQSVYMNILNQAKDYVYIMTPYLIIDTEMTNSLILAAKRGVDVRIVTPGIPDKKMVFGVTRSYYSILMRNGIKIYEYTPGFVHGKIFVSDDEIATVGTINLDYRSLYLHFENGTLLYQSKEVNTVKQDMVQTIAESKLVQPQDTKKNMLIEFFWSAVRLFAPLL